MCLFEWMFCVHVMIINYLCNLKLETCHWIFVTYCNVYETLVTVVLLSVLLYQKGDVYYIVVIISRRRSRVMFSDDYLNLLALIASSRVINQKWSGFPDFISLDLSFKQHWNAKKIFNFLFYFTLLNLKVGFRGEAFKQRTGFYFLPPSESHECHLMAVNIYSYAVTHVCE